MPSKERIVKAVECESGIIHAIFECTDCGAHWEDFRAARKLGYAHAKRTGHAVEGEVGIAYQYNRLAPRPPKRAKSKT